MNELPEAVPTRAEADAEARLRVLGRHVADLQAAMVRLLQDVARAEARIELGSSGHLVEANEQLVVAALNNLARAELATAALRNLPPAANIDALTRLPNRGALLDRFDQASANARRNHTRLALLFLDLDGFKQLNDLHGHGFGDQVLRLAAQRMVSVVREVDTVSRHGGDEFLILLGKLGQAADARAVAEKLNAAISAPAEVDGVAVQLSASVGIALYPDDGQDADTLVARADAAMYRSKRRGNGGVASWTALPAPPPGAPPAAAPRPVWDGIGTQLRDVNEHLVIAAVGAQALQAQAESTCARHAAIVADVVRQMGDRQAPIRAAVALLDQGAVSESMLPRLRDLVEQQLRQMVELAARLGQVSAPGTEHGDART